MVTRVALDHVSEGSTPSSPAKTTPQQKLDLFHLAFVKDDAEKLPYILRDEFSFGVIIALKGQKHLVSEEVLRALQEEKEKQLHPPRIKTLLQTAQSLQKSLKPQEEFTRSNLGKGLNLTMRQITQILSLLKLAPKIQDYILSMPPVNGRSPISERALRPITKIRGHKKQIEMFNELIN